MSVVCENVHNWEISNLSSTMILEPEDGTGSFGLMYSVQLFYCFQNIILSQNKDKSYRKYCDV